ncbi:MAG: hypothetical protein RMJ46_08965, partial [Bacteroidota bacterium]|nr:hypothetical protein [Bacteroidota bacterium]
MDRKSVGLTFAKTISYCTKDFVRLNWEIFRAIPYSPVLLQGRRIRFLGDRGLDDEKTFTFVTCWEKNWSSTSIT